MNEISHKINKDGDVEINATINNNTYAAVIISCVIEGKAYIKKDSIDTYRLDNEQETKEKIVTDITSQGGKYNETLLMVEDD